MICSAGKFHSRCPVQNRCCHIGSLQDPYLNSWSLSLIHIFNASGSAVIPSLEATYARCATVSSTPIRLKSYIWQRERMVGSILCFSVVARMNMAWRGGSSSVFRKALKAEADSICTSSMIYTCLLYTSRCV